MLQRVPFFPRTTTTREHQRHTLFERAPFVVVSSKTPLKLLLSSQPSDALFGSPNGEFPIADCGTEKRPNAINVPFERTKKALSGSNVDILQTFEKNRAIITHCGGGGRGQKSKEWFEKRRERRRPASERGVGYVWPFVKTSRTNESAINVRIEMM